MRGETAAELRWRTLPFSPQREPSVLSKAPRMGWSARGKAPRFAIFPQDLPSLLKRNPCKVVLRRAMWHWQRSKQRVSHSSFRWCRRPLGHSGNSRVSRDVDCGRCVPPRLRAPNPVPLHFPFFFSHFASAMTCSHKDVSSKLAYAPLSQIYDNVEKFLLSDIPVPHGNRPLRAPSSFPRHVHARR